MSAVKVILEYVRESPESSVPVKQERQDRLTDIIFILMIFSISYWLKFLIIDYYIQVVGNNSSFHFRNNYEEFYWLTSLFGWEPGQEIVIEGYVDFSWYYLPYVDNFAEGWNPYEGEATAIYFPERMSGYVYGPLYIVWISIGKIFFGLDAATSVLVSNVIFDSLTSVMVYILSKRVTGNGIALILGFIHTIAPISLFYANIYGLNTPQMTFFAVLYLWFYLEHHDSLGFIILVLGFLTKQFPLLFAMPALMFMVRRYGWLRGFAFLVEFILWSLIFSMPFIVLSPVAYIIKLFLASRAPSSVPTKEFLEENGGIAPNLVSSAVAFEDYSLAQELHLLVDTQLLFVGGLFFISYTAFSAYRILEERPYLYYRFAALFYFFAHGSIGRGIYKYYTPFLIPFLILALAPYRMNTIHLRLGKLIHDAWKKTFNPKFRLETPPSRYWTIFLLNVLILYLLWIFVDWSVSLFVPPENRIWFSIFIFISIIFSLVKPHPTPSIREELTVDLQFNETENPFNRLREKFNLSSSQRRRISTVISFFLTILVFNYFYSIFFYDSLLVRFLHSPSIIFVLAPLFAGTYGWKRSITPSNYKYQSMSTFGTFVISVAIFLLYLVTPPKFFMEGHMFLGLVSFDVMFSAIVALMGGEILSSGVLYGILKSKENIDKPLTIDFDDLGVSLLLFLGFFFISMISTLFFGSSSLKETWFLTLATFMILAFQVQWLFLDDNKENRPYMNFNHLIWIIDLIQLTLLILIVFIVNVMIMSIPRLLNPALIFIIALSLIPFMGEEFWFALRDFNFGPRTRKAIRNILVGNTTT